MISLRTIPYSESGTPKLNPINKVAVLKIRQRKLYPSPEHVFAATKSLQLRSNRIGVIFALCKDAKIVCTRNILIPSQWTRRLEFARGAGFAGFAKLSSISNKYERCFHHNFV